MNGTYGRQVEQSANGTELVSVHVVQGNVIFKEFGKLHDLVVVEDI